MPAPNRQYRDLDLDFFSHPVTGAISALDGRDAVRRSVRNLVLTSNYERYFRPWIGSVVENSLFMPANLVTESQIKQSVIDVITNNEPRVLNLKVDIRFDIDRNGYEIVMTFEIKNIQAPIDLKMFLKRTR